MNKITSHIEVQAEPVTADNLAVMWTIADTGKTDGGNTRDVKVQRVGRVTIYQRGRTFYAYYRPNGKTIRHRLACDLETARAKATQIAVVLNQS